jgi:putative oxidoreductase
VSVVKRKLAFGALAIAVIINGLWFAHEAFVGQRPIVYSLAFVLLFAVLLFTRERWPWLAGLLRIAVGLNFGLAVLDRFGVFGPFGAAGVSWGDWPHFVAYTQQVNAFFPSRLAPALAIAATIYEIVLTVTLVLGISSRSSLKAAALLLLAYGTAMTLSFGFTSQLEYAVIVLCAGALALTTLDATYFSVDALSHRHLVRLPRESTDDTLASSEILR